MCLIIHRPADAPAIPAGWLADFWNKNPDGFGAWYIDKARGEIIIKKTLQEDEAMPIIREIESLGVEAGFHWRQATHGSETLDNVHPFVVNARDGRVVTVLAHNGVLGQWYEQPKEGRGVGPSDTVQFLERAFKPLISAFGIKQLWTPGTSGRKLLDLSLGSGYQNRLLITNLRNGFSRVGDTWVTWRRMALSNSYAWSWSKREMEDGPSVSVPFSSGGQGALPYSAYYGASYRRTNASASCDVDTSRSTASGSQSMTLSSMTTAATSGSTDPSSALGGHVIPKYPSATEINGRLYRAPNTAIPYWHWEDREGRCFLQFDDTTPFRGTAKAGNGREAETEEHTSTPGSERPLESAFSTSGDDPSVAKIAAKIVRGLISAAVASSEEDGAQDDAGHSVAGDGLTHDDADKILAEAREDARKRLAKQKEREAGSDERLKCQILGQMSFTELYEWLCQEPDEATALLQSLLWEAGGDYE